MSREAALAMHRITYDGTDAATRNRHYIVKEIPAPIMTLPTSETQGSQGLLEVGARIIVCEGGYCLAQ